jgi:ribonuclease H2 subunit A
VFGLPSIARFSWATVKVLLSKDAHEVKWYVITASLLTCKSKINTIVRIDEGQAGLINEWRSDVGLDKDRCAVARDLSLKSVAAL